MGVTQFGPRFGSRLLGPAAIGLAILAAWLPGLAVAQWGVVPAPPPGGGATEEAVAASHTSVPEEGARVIGFLADAGLPDGLMAALVVRPIPYLRLHAGGGTNTSSAGIRGGISVLPLGAGPSLNLEVGHYFSGEANGLVSATVRGLGRFSEYVNRVAYTFANAHAGLEFGDRRFTFYVHGGLTFLRATLSDVTPPETQSDSGRTTVAFNRDPIVRLLTPSAKLGLIYYLP
jgi:hypothetical protein